MAQQLRYTEANNNRNEPDWTRYDPGFKLFSTHQKKSSRKTVRLELAFANQMVDAIFTNATDGLILLDSDRVIQRTNTAFLELFGLQVNRVEGQPLADILPSDKLIDAFGGKTEKPETEIELTLERPIRCSLLVAIAQLKIGQFQGWILTVTDRTERKRLDYQKMEFVTLASHELNTPLTNLMCDSELLNETLEEPNESMNSVLRAGYRLRDIVKQLIVFTQVTNGTLQSADSSPVNLVAHLRDIVSDLEPHARDNQVPLRIETNVEDISIDTNTILLHAALYQLILNGITFNHPGEEVVIKVVQTTDRVVIQIADTGIGIPASELSSIFEPFHQVAEHNARHVGGLGLGLSIVQHALEQLGGTISVTSDREQGAIFAIELPRCSTS